MQINSHNIKTALAEVATSPQVNSIRRLNEIRFNNNFKSFEKIAAQNQTDIFPSEKLEIAPSIQEYNLKLQANSQIANLENSNKVFNELKAGNVKLLKGASKYQTHDSNLEDENISNEVEPDLEYYVVLNRTENDSALDQIKSHTDILYERIRDVYKLGFKKEPGTLVNLVY